MKSPSDLSLLRRYIVARAAGRLMPEWSYFIPQIVPGLSAWVRADDRTAKRAEHWRRIRRSGAPWCLWLGNQLAIAEDTALQAFFLTVPEGAWGRMETAIRRSPLRCLRDWRANGHRLIEALQDDSDLPHTHGPLSRWPARRGVGTRSLLAPR